MDLHEYCIFKPGFAIILFTLKNIQILQDSNEVLQSYLTINKDNYEYLLTHKFLIFPDVALERETEGDFILADMGEGVPFRAGSFDGAVSVSAIQWLFNADKKSHQPVKRLYKFFSTLYASLVSYVLFSLSPFCQKILLSIEHVFCCI